MVVMWNLSRNHLGSKFNMAVLTISNKYIIINSMCREQNIPREHLVSEARKMTIEIDKSGKSILQNCLRL